MKKIVLSLLLATTTLSFADVFDDACKDYDSSARTKKMTILEYAEGLSTRTNQARNANKQDEADKLLKFFTVTVSTCLKFGIDNNPAPSLVNRLLKAMDNAYSPLSKIGISPKDLAESFADMDEVFEASKTQKTLDQYAAVVHYSYHAVGLDKIKPWDQISKITALKTTSPSLIFKSLFNDAREKDKPKVITVTLTPKKKEKTLTADTTDNHKDLQKDLENVCKFLTYNTNTNPEKLNVSPTLSLIEEFVSLSSAKKELEHINRSITLSLIEEFVSLSSAEKELEDLNRFIALAQRRDSCGNASGVSSMKFGCLTTSRDDIQKKVAKYNEHKKWLTNKGINNENLLQNLVKEYLNVAYELFEKGYSSIVVLDKIEMKEGKLIGVKPQIRYSTDKKLKLTKHCRDDIYYDLPYHPQRMNILGQLASFYEEGWMKENYYLKQANAIKQALGR